MDGGTGAPAGSFAPLFIITTVATTARKEKTNAVMRTAHHGTSGYKGFGGFGRIGSSVAGSVDAELLLELLIVYSTILVLSSNNNGW
jgi:hypothetical protein